MKKNLVILIVLLILGVNLFSQASEKEENNNNPAFYEFSLTYQGVSMFMEDLEAYDQENYDLLLPQFEKVKAKRKRAFITGGVVSGVGAAILTTAITLAVTTDSPSDNQDLLLAGMGFFGSITMGGGFITAEKMQPHEDDYYRLVNLYNRNNPDSPINVRKEVVLR